MIFRDQNGAMIGYDAVTNTVMTGPNDVHGHGTHCAGIAAAQTNNTTGMANLAWNGVTNSTNSYNIKIMPVKVLDDTGSGTDEDVAEGMHWAADHGAEVISLSLGDFATSAILDEGVQYAHSKGVLVVAARAITARHASSIRRLRPTPFRSARQTQTICSFRGRHTETRYVAAPGAAIYSTLRTNNYGTMSGTSMACPFVAGLAAFLRAQNPTLTQVRDKQPY